MGMEWRDFLTQKEIEEVDRIKEWVEYAIVMKKMGENEEDFNLARNMAFPCMCLCMEQEDAETREHDEGLEKGIDPDIEQLLAEACKFSLRYGLCQCPYYGTVRAVEKWDEERKREEERELEGLVDEELPF